MEDLSLHLLDIAENSIAAGADRIVICVREDTERDTLTLEVRDNGKGMDEEIAAMVTDPFYTSKTVRRVGLGIPLLKQAAEECCGSLSLSSDKGKGTTVTAHFRRSHIDRKPLGDVAATMMVLIAGTPHIDFVLEYWKNGHAYALDTGAIKRELEDVPINTPEVLRLIREDITSGLCTSGEEIHGKT